MSSVEKRIKELRRELSRLRSQKEDHESKSSAAEELGQHDLMEDHWSEAKRIEHEEIPPVKRALQELESLEDDTDA